MAGIEPSPGQECPVPALRGMSFDAVSLRSEGGAIKKTPYQEVVVSVYAKWTRRDAITCQVARSLDGVLVGET